MSFQEMFTDKFFHSYFNQVGGTEDKLNDAYVLLISKILDLPASQNKKLNVMVQLDSIYEQYEARQ